MELTAALIDLCKGVAQPIIAIDGPAGGGKTTLAQNLALAFATSLSATVIHMDDLYDGWDGALDDDFSSVLSNIVGLHKESENISYSPYNWSDGKFDESKEVPGTQLLILEGVGSGQSSIRASLAALIWIDINDSQGLARVIARDGESIRVPMEKWLTLQKQHFHLEGTQNAADFILTT
jgi:uridine kinase